MDAISMNMPVQAPSADPMGAAAGLQGGMDDGGFGELFAELIGQMAGQGGEDADLLLALLGAGKGKNKDDLMNMLGMQMAAEGLFTPQMLQQLMEQTGAGQLEQSGAVQALADLLDAQKFELWGEMPVRPEASEELDEELKELFETLSAEWQPQRTESSREGSIEDRMYFQSALRQAQQEVAQRPREQEEQKSILADIEALQQAVDSRQFLAGTPAAADSAAPTPTVEQVADQIKTGILTNLGQGKQEFVVRLKPDGLGEIEVRFTEDKNSVSLRIITSSAAVGRMLANDVAQLQNALRPLNAQVQEIVTVPQANEANAAQTQLMGEQSQGQYARHYQNESTGAQAQEEEFDQAMEEIIPDDAALNLLI